VKDVRHAEAHINRAIAFFGDRSIKENQYAELDDFLTSLPEDISSKTKHNIFTTLHTFWIWVYNREKKRGFVMPDWPETKFTLGWRQIVDKETQAAIIDEVKRISYHRNPRTWFAIFVLASYPKVRPGELIQVNEKDVNRTTGEMWIRHTKEGKEKRIYLLEEDLAFVNSLPVGLPDLPFFRHEKMKGISQEYCMKALGRFGKDYLYQTWKAACKNLGIEGVDLYGGTKHSTVTAAREIMTPEEIRRYVTEHQTNVAFDRYLQVDAQKQREASTKIRASLHTSYIHENEGDTRAKILKFRN
jgi:integrase